MKSLAIAITAILLTSCASQQEMQILANNSTAVAQMQSQAAMTQPKTFSLECGNQKDACKGMKFSYIDPRDRQKVTGVNIRGTNDVIIGVAPSVTNAIGWIAGSIAATRIVSDIASTAGGGNTTTHNTTSVVGDDNADIGKSTISGATSSTTSTTSSADGNSQQNDNIVSRDNANDNNNSQQNQETVSADNSQQNQDTTTSTDNTNNSQQNQVDDNTNNSQQNQDSTSTPTVVNPVVAP